MNIQMAGEKLVTEWLQIISDRLTEYGLYDATWPTLNIPGQRDTPLFTLHREYLQTTKVSSIFSLTVRNPFFMRRADSQRI